MKTKTGILIFAFYLISYMFSYGTTYYVNGLAGDDLNDGLSAIPLTAFHGPKKTISAAMDLVHPFDTVIISTGLYHEAITIDSVMVLIGAGSGTDTLTNTVIKSSVPNSGIGITLNSGGVDSLNRMIIKNIRVDDFQYGIMFASNTTYENVAAVNNAVYGFYLPNGQVTDMEQILCQASYNAQGGIYIGHTADVDGWLIDSCLLEGNTFSGLYIFCNNPSTGNVKNFIFRNSILRKNFQKGMYIEKLQDALFENLIVDSCGYNPSYSYNAGIDINLKYNNYSNITIRFCDITNCGTGGSNAFGCGLIVKGRDDGSTYGANPATLSNVLISNITLTGCLNGLIAGEPNASNNTPTNVSVQLSDLSGNTLYALVNNIISDVEAHNNWWGQNAQPDTALISKNDIGEVNVYTYHQIGIDMWPYPGFESGAFATFDPNIHTLEEAANVVPQFYWFYVPSYTYHGTTTIRNKLIMQFCNNVTIENLVLDSSASINTHDTGFAVSASIIAKDWSWMIHWNAGIELLQNATISEAVRNVIQGLVFTERILSIPSTEDFGGLGLEITAGNSGTPPGNIIVKRYTDLIYPGNNFTKVPREFDVMSQYNQGLDATLKYIYDDSEIDSISSENNLALFRSMDNGNTWILEGGYLDTANNSITITGLDSIRGLWCAFDSTGYISIAENSSENYVQLYPNPSSTGIFILLTEGPCSIRVLDASARIIYQEELKYHGRIIKKLNLSNVPKGMYFLEMKSLKGQKVIKKIINN